MMREGAVSFFIEYIQDNDNDIIARQYCAMALGNLASDPTIHEVIIEGEGIEALLVLLHTQDPEGGKYAAFALANLASDVESRAIMVEKGAIPGLTYLACCDDVLAQQQALTTLRAICLTYVHLQKVVDDGILDPLILLSRNNADLKLLREVATFLNVLSTVDENKQAMAHRAMVSLTALMMHTDPIVEQQAVSAIANIMEDKV